MSASPAPLVQMIGISKEFPGVRALDNVDFSLERGEVHVLFGENGAGKSTLISILSGVYRPTSGRLLIEGREVVLTSVHDAIRYGIGTVFQEFSLVPTLTVYENVYLGREPARYGLIGRKAMRAGAAALLADLGFDIDADRRVSALNRAEQQMVEIAKAFNNGLRILILDEPTASLTEKETRKLFGFVRRARALGVGIIYISHRIQEFTEIGDRITVLRDGRKIATLPIRDASEAALLELMTGRTIDKVYPEIASQPQPRTILEIRNLHASGVTGVDIDVRAGEVLGVAGLAGSGKSRIWRTVMGLQPAAAGTVRLNGIDMTNAGPRRLLDSGVFYLPPDRRAEGLQLSASARENIWLSLLSRSDVSWGLGFVRARRTRELAAAIAIQARIANSLIDRAVAKLSGGNQQKVLFAKGLSVEREVYILDEPTVGVDMGSRIELYRLIQEISETGKAVVVVSSDLLEVMHLAHRLVIFSKGRIAAELGREEITEENVLGHFFSEANAAA